MIKLLLLILAVAVCSAQHSIKRVLVPPSFTQLNIASPDLHIPFYFAVQQQNINVLEKELIQRSDPQHSSYGQWLSQSAVTRLTAKPESTAFLLQWLKHNLFFNIQPTATGDYVHATGTHKLMQQHFQATMYHYTHKDTVVNSTQPHVHTNQYEIPSFLAPHVSFIGQISDFIPPAVHQTSIWSSAKSVRSSSRLQTKDLKGNTTIDLINKVYNISSNQVRPHGGATQGLLAIGQAYNTTDFVTFASRFNITTLSNITTSDASKGNNFPFECTHSPNTCLEASLDQETICGVAQGASTVFWNADPNSQMWFDSYMIYLVNAADGVAPLINSFSYDILEKTWNGDLKNQFSINAMKLGVRGITVLTASGDDGVAGYGTRSHGQAQCGYHPAFPASNPWVLTVGATVGPEVGQKEVACTYATGGLISSGGGFSNWYPQPQYQTQAVDQYLSNVSGKLRCVLIFM